MTRVFPDSVRKDIVSVLLASYMRLFVRTSYSIRKGISLLGGVVLRPYINVYEPYKRILS